MTNEEMAIRIKAGESDLIEALWEQNKRLIHWKANGLFIKYRERCIKAGVEYDDIMQVAFLALCNAIRDFDPSTGYKLMTYLNFPLRNGFSTLIGIRNRGRNPLNDYVSLNIVIGEEGTTELVELQLDPESETPFEAVLEDLYNIELRNALENSLSKLPPKQAIAIRGRYFDGKTQKDIAAETGITHQNVHNLQRDGFTRLRRDRKLKEYCDDILSNYAYKRTGYNSFRNNMASSVEMAVIKADEARRRFFEPIHRGRYYES